MLNTAKGHLILRSTLLCDFVGFASVYILLLCVFQEVKCAKNVLDMNCGENYAHSLTHSHAHIHAHIMERRKRLPCSASIAVSRYCTNPLLRRECGGLTSVSWTNKTPSHPLRELFSVQNGTERGCFFWSLFGTGLCACKSFFLLGQPWMPEGQISAGGSGMLGEKLWDWQPSVIHLWHRVCFWWQGC